jgi:hypothetical protein
MLFAIIGLFAVFHPTILSGLGLIQTDPGDTRLNNYILEHGYRWIIGDNLHRKFWNPPIFFPATNTAAYSDILLGTAPIYWLFRAFHLPYDTSFQLWMMTVLLLNFLLTFLLLNRVLGLSIIASCGGAYIFAFGGIRISQLGHQQLLPQFYSIVVIYCLFQIFKKPDQPGHHGPVHNIIIIPLFFTSAALQLYASFYLGWFLCFGLLVLLIVSLVFQESRFSLLYFLKINWPVMLISVLLFLLAMSWMGYHYMICYHEMGNRTWSETADQVPRLLSWMDMGPDNWVYAWTRKYLNFSSLQLEWEHRIGLGLLTMGIALMGMIKMSKMFWGKLVLLAFLIIAALAFMFPGGWTPWHLVRYLLPGAGAIRGVARLSLLWLIVFSFGVAFFLDGLKHKKLAILLLFLVCLEQIQTTPSYSKSAMRAEVNNLAQLIPKNCTTFYYLPRDYGKYQLNAMWAQMITEIPTINAFSDWYPKKPSWFPLRGQALKTKNNSSDGFCWVNEWLHWEGFRRYETIQIEENGDYFYCLRLNDMDVSYAINGWLHEHGFERYEIIRIEENGDSVYCVRLNDNE